LATDHGRKTVYYSQIFMMTFPDILLDPIDFPDGMDIIKLSKNYRRLYIKYLYQADLFHGNGCMDLPEAEGIAAT